MSIDGALLEGILFGLRELYLHYVLAGAFVTFAAGLLIGWMGRSASYGRWRVKKGD